MNHTLKTKEHDLLLVTVPEDARSCDIDNEESAMTYVVEEETVIDVDLSKGNYEILGEIDHEGKCSFDVTPFIVGVSAWNKRTYFLSILESQSIPLPKEGEKYVVLKAIN